MSLIISQLFTLALGAASIYYFYQNNFWAAVLLFAWSISRASGFNLKLLARGIENVQRNHKCNIAMEFFINIKEVLNHESINQLFNKLNENKIIQGLTKEEWSNQLLDNYAEKYKPDSDFPTWAKVKFNIKNNLIWKNDQIHFLDCIFEEFHIPYFKDKKPGFDDIENTLNLRIFVVNGIIKLQIGSFNKKYSPKFLKNTGLKVYITNETITSFPLMYFPYDFPIPQEYLQLSASSTDSYKNRFSENKNEQKNAWYDWKKLNQEVREYNYLCETADEPVSSIGKWKKVKDLLDKKREEYLSKEGFGKGPYDRKTFVNKYLNLVFTNFSEIKEDILTRGFTDYYEESY